MVKEAEEFKEQDEALKEKVESRNKLESYLFSVKSSMLSDDKMKTALGDDVEMVEKTTKEGLEWLEDSSDSSRTKEEYETKYKEAEGILMPLVQKAYQSNVPAGEGMPAGGMDMPTEDATDDGPKIDEVD